MSSGGHPHAGQSGQDVRLLCRNNQWNQPTAGLAPTYAQANLVVLDADWAEDFSEFCQSNPAPCPVLEKMERGSYEAVESAPGSDLRTDLPRYRVLENGQATRDVESIVDLWHKDLVAFLIGCSFSFEHALLDNDIPVRHIECNCNVPMFRTNVATRPAGRLSGPLVVSMRPMSSQQAKEAARITAALPRSHGAPIHIGDPSEIGISNIQCPDFGQAVPVHEDEVCVFWACGVTPFAVLEDARVPFAITHAPGHMFLTDLRE